MRILRFAVTTFVLLIGFAPLTPEAGLSEVASGITWDPPSPPATPTCGAGDGPTTNKAWTMVFTVKKQLICPPVIPIETRTVNSNGIGACGSQEVNPGVPKCPPEFLAPSGGEISNGRHWFTQDVRNYNYFMLEPVPLVGWCSYSVTTQTKEDMGETLDFSGCPSVDCSMCDYPASGPGECAIDGGGWYNYDCECCVNDQTPIVINVAGSLELSSPAEGVLFDIAVKGFPRQVPWLVAPNNGWLVLDRNGNGSIDDGRELFGNRTPLANGGTAPNGFVALAELDRNADGLVDRSDPEFERLAVWFDNRRNGTVDPGELVPLALLQIVALEVDYKESRRTDRWGNVFRYRAAVWFERGSKRFAYDVFLTQRQ